MISLRQCSASILARELSRQPASRRIGSYPIGASKLHRLRCSRMQLTTSTEPPSKSSPDAAKKNLNVATDENLDPSSDASSVTAANASAATAFAMASAAATADAESAAQQCQSEQSSKSSSNASNTTHSFSFRTEALMQYLNDVSGTTRLETMKRLVKEKESAVQREKRLLRESRAKYVLAVESHQRCQADIASLLQRKANWTASDVSQFTLLVGDEHSLSENEKTLKSSLQSLENSVDLAQEEYDALLRERYQEELSLAERNRGLSNALTWGMLGLNTAIFIFTQLVVEPRRRKHAEQLMRQISEEMRESISQIQHHSDALELHHSHNQVQQHPRQQHAEESNSSIFTGPTSLKQAHQLADEAYISGSDSRSNNGDKNNRSERNKTNEEGGQSNKGEGEKTGSGEELLVYSFSNLNSPPTTTKIENNSTAVNSENSIGRESIIKRDSVVDSIRKASKGEERSPASSDPIHSVIPQLLLSMPSAPKLVKFLRSVIGETVCFLGTLKSFSRYLFITVPRSALVRAVGGEERYRDCCAAAVREINEGQVMGSGLMLLSVVVCQSLRA